MLTLDIKIKELFFDRLPVKAQLDKDQLRFLRNAGGFARKTARNSMKRKGKARKPPKNMNGRAYAKWLEEAVRQPASPPGTPPFAHTDSKVETLKNILFAFGGKNSVLVGPVGLNGKRGSLPALHEYGGTQGISEKLIGASAGDKRAVVRSSRRWVPVGRRKPAPGQPTRRRQATYPARPYMAPAMAKTQSKFKDLWFTSAASARAA